MATYKRHCRGCTSFKNSGCHVWRNNSKGKCPCSLCVVKPICNRFCEEWDTWRLKVRWKKNCYQTRGRKREKL